MSFSMGLISDDRADAGISRTRPRQGKPPASMALFSDGGAEEFAAAAALGFSHALLSPSESLAGEMDTARSAGMAPVVALDPTQFALAERLRTEGAGGFYFRRAHEMLEFFRAGFISGLKECDADMVAIAEIFGAPAPSLQILNDAGFDFATSSLCYWNFRDDWLNADTARVERLGRAFCFATPPGAALNNEVQIIRALRASAMFSPGWGVSKTLFLGNATLEGEISQLLAKRRADCRFAGSKAARVVSPTAAPLAVLLRQGLVAVANASLHESVSARTSAYLPDIEAGSLRSEGGETLGPLDKIQFGAGEARYYEILPLPPVSRPAPKLNPKAPRITVDAVTPSVDAGRYPARRILGEAVTIEADLICDGHEHLAGEILYRCQDERSWRAAPMSLIENDRWRGEIPAPRMGRCEFVVSAWIDRYRNFTSGLEKKIKAGQAVSLEIQEGMLLVEEAMQASAVVREMCQTWRGATEAELEEKLLSPAYAKLISAALPRQFLTKSQPYSLDAEPLRARYASWYEIFPRSQSGDGQRHGTFRDVVRQLPRIAAMGFDVLYFPPIHPIGHTNRKGRNNSLRAEPGDPGSPYAIGNEAGGHDAIHPELGTLDDFRDLIRAAKQYDIDIALDFAIQCSPDHPWLREHPEWFAWRPDGSLRHAENPPKKYEDIVNVEFYAEKAQPALWHALRDVVQFWVDQGIRYFRVDNPHTKPLPFWEWMIGDIRSRQPDAIFLAEAFTRPKLMYQLAKIGFSQSYTYFTWRHTKRELTEYLEELNEPPVREFFRPHFFVNTPDINPVFLQNSGRPGFLIRAALAATLSGLFGIYNGFELCEATPVPGKEEYLDSEKYQLRAWNYDSPQNIGAEITRLNHIRRTNTALQTHLNVEFLPCDNEQVLYFRKTAADGNTLLVAISLDPFNPQQATLELPLWRFGLPDDGALAAMDLVRDVRFVWHGKYQPVYLNPAEIPYCIWHVSPRT